jgi:hypothetical protein
MRRPMPPNRARWASVLCALAAASALVLSTQGLAWWSYSEAEVYLLRSQRCFGGECQAAGQTWLGASIWWHRLTAATFGVGLFAALLSVFVAGARAAGRIPRLAAGSLMVAVVTCIACAIGALITFPRLASPTWNWGPAVYAGGLGLAWISAFMVRRTAAP